MTHADGNGFSVEAIAAACGHTKLSKMLGLQAKHQAAAEAKQEAERKKAKPAKERAAHEAARKARLENIPITTPVEEVIAQGLISLAITDDILSEGGDKKSDAEDLGATRIQPSVHKHNSCPRIDMYIL